MKRTAWRSMWAGVCVAACAGAGLSACSHTDPSSDLTSGAEAARPVAALMLAPGEYPRAFGVSRDVLRDFGFAIERVDAQAGVITTQPKGTGGIVTPWDSEQSTFAQELEDAGQRHRRVARLEFVPVDGAGAVMAAGLGGSGGGVPDLRRFSGPVEARAWVDVYRWHQTQWRLNTMSIRDSSYAIDTDLEARGMTLYGVAHAQDPALAERIVLALRRALGSEASRSAEPGVPETEGAQAPAAAAPPVMPAAEPAPPEPAAPIAPAPSPAPSPPQPTPPAPEPEWQKGEPLRKP